MHLAVSPRPGSGPSPEQSQDKGEAPPRSVSLSAIVPQRPAQCPQAALTWQQGKAEAWCLSGAGGH